jgi:Uma2 family endonuclease
MAITIPPQTIIYPHTDGKPMAENTLQFRWIVTIKEGVDRLFHDRPDVFVAGDLFWYPVEGHPEICTAPDTLVAFGRPRGDRLSYMQWEEGGIAPQVVFEVLSPANRPKEMSGKFAFYEQHGVEEYYIYDPDRVKLTGFVRTGNELREIPVMHGWTSPLLGIRFDLSGSELIIYRPDGQRFLTYQEVAEELERFAQERDQAAQERDRMAKDLETQRQRNERMAAQLRAMGIEPAS